MTRYRYVLNRELATDRNNGTVLFVMLNPSTADRTSNDPTIRRCIGFATRWGFSRLRVVNLYAARATKPADLFALNDPVGPQNDWYLARELERADRIVAGWGHHGARFDRARHVIEAHADRRWYCLGTTKDGEPRHPLYVKSSRRVARLRPTS